MQKRGRLVRPKDRIQVQIQVDPSLGPAAAAAVAAADLAAAVRAALQARGIRGGSVSLAVVDDEEIQGLNRTFRGVDSPTDVLSFSAHEANPEDPLAAADLPPDLRAALHAHWGDLCIAYPYTLRQAERFANPLSAELRLLAVHGVLHLLGYDHATPAQEAEMWAIQDAILIGLGDRASGPRAWDL